MDTAAGVVHAVELAADLTYMKKQGHIVPRWKSVEEMQDLTSENIRESMTQTETIFILKYGSYKYSHT